MLSTRITHWLGIHFATRQCHRFEYQTPIKATSLALCELRHAVRGRWTAQGARILELLSQNIDGTEPVPATLQPKTRVNVLQVTFWEHRRVYLFREEDDWAWSTCLFLARLDLHTVAAGRWTTTASYRRPLNHFTQTILLKGFCPYVYSAVNTAGCTGSALPSYTVGLIDWNKVFRYL